MTQSIMRYCRHCAEYTLQDACPKCKGIVVQNTPAKYSPEDPYGVYRRKLKKLDAAKKDQPKA